MGEQPAIPGLDAEIEELRVRAAQELGQGALELVFE